MEFLLTCFLFQCIWCQYYYDDNLDGDDAYLLDRLLGQDYPQGGYEYQDDNDRPSYMDKQQQPRNEKPTLNFPEINARQKQFAVNPGVSEYDSKNLDFLNFRLEALDPPSDDAKLEEQLQSILGAVGDEVASADKRGLLGGPRYSPLVADDYEQEEVANDFLFTSLIAGVTAASVFIVIGAGYCYHKSVLKSKGCEDVEYPAYGVTGPAKESSPSGDRKLAQSAQMYHYQHQKNQMIGIRGNGHHEEDSEGEQECEEADYTVYECPGLASVI